MPRTIASCLLTTITSIRNNWSLLTWCKAVILTKVDNRDQPLYAVSVMGVGMGRSAFSPIIADSVALRSVQGVAGG